MDIKDIMKLDINNLKKQKHEILTKHAIKILSDIIQHLKKGDYSKIEEMLAYSPAGDGMGCENHFIDFNFRNTESDINDLIVELKFLKDK
jgi:hypothetical protein